MRWLISLDLSISSESMEIFIERLLSVVVRSAIVAFCSAKVAFHRGEAVNF